MSSRDWLKVIVLVLLPINAWLGVFHYLHWHRQKALREIPKHTQQVMAKMVRYSYERHGIKEGQKLRYPFPYPITLIGNPPPVGQGAPVLFVNISWIAAYEVWQPAIQEALNASPYLHVALLYCKPEGIDLKPIRKMIQQFNHPRLSAFVGGFWMATVFGNEWNGGFLLFLCDGSGIVRAIEPYPDLKVSPHWKDELADWRPKLHQAVKKVLDEFLPKRP